MKKCDLLTQTQPGTGMAERKRKFSDSELQVLTDEVQRLSPILHNMTTSHCNREESHLGWHGSLDVQWHRF